MTRPVSVTVVAWGIIALALEGLFGIAAGLVAPVLQSGVIHSTLSLPVALWVAAASLAITIVLAALMLAGFGWARIVYVCILAFTLLGLVLQRQPLFLAILTGVKVALFSYFLFRREANVYFSTMSATNGLTSASSGRDR